MTRIVRNIYGKKYFSKKINITPDLTDLIETTIREGQPLKLFYLWGLHKKCRINEFDEAALLFLSSIFSHIENIMFGLSRTVEFTLVLSDSHAVLNGIPDDCIQSYSNDVRKWASSSGWSTKFLSELWDAYGLTQTMINEEAETIPDTAINDLLHSFATKYFSSADKMIGAKRYQVARLMEKSIIEKEFAGYIHLTAADTRLSSLQPSLPHFHVWTVKRGSSKKPWFMYGTE